MRTDNLWGEGLEIKLRVCPSFAGWSCSLTEITLIGANMNLWFNFTTKALFCDMLFDVGLKHSNVPYWQSLWTRITENIMCGLKHYGFDFCERWGAQEKDGKSRVKKLRERKREEKDKTTSLERVMRTLKAPAEPPPICLMEAILN